ncbi:MAG: hypothetical protein F6J97_25330, partial [Leptolyngbya sp. SIO4C1]|nr:hypothetical protein [Leptolyngbya sp. SIO4C1]
MPTVLLFNLAGSLSLSAQAANIGAVDQPLNQHRASAIQQTVALSNYETAYTLGAGDRIQVDILRVPQYSGEHEVLIDGTLNLPVVG